MPPLPELPGISRLIRRVEVLRKIKAHQHSHSGSDVGIARKVGVNLEGISEQGGEVLKTGVKKRVLEDSVAEIHSKVIAENQLLGQSVKDPEDGETKLGTPEEERLVELGDEFLCPDDRASYKLRKEAQVEAEIQEIPHRLDAALVFGCGSTSGDIHDIADSLEDKEGDADREEDRINAENSGTDHRIAPGSYPVFHDERSAEQIVQHIRYEIGVFIITEQRKVHHDARHHDKSPPELSLAIWQQQACQIVIDYHEDQEHQEQPAGLVIEEQAHEEKEGVPQESLILEQAKESQDYGEERPEVELGEQQRMGLIKSEQVPKKPQRHFSQTGHVLLLKCSIYLAMKALNNKSPIIV